MIIERRSTPIRTLSLAFSKSIISTTFLSWRAASSAASLTRLARSAPGEAGRAAGEDLEVDLGRERDPPRVHLEDLLAALHVGPRHHHLAVEAAGPQQRGVQHVGPVGGRDEDDALVGLEAVHLDQELVQGLLALVVPAAQARAPVPADRVDLVHEDDAGRVLLALLEEVAHARGAHAHEHLDEVRAGDREERHVGLARDGLGQQGLAGAGRAHQEHALGDLAPELLELGRILEELDDLAQLFLGLVHARHVLERDLVLLLRDQPGPRLAEGQGLGAPALHLAHEEDPDADEEQHRAPTAGRWRSHGLVSAGFTSILTPRSFRDLTRSG